MAKIRPRSSSLTVSCNTVNPVTYEVPAHAPTNATDERGREQRRQRGRDHQEHARAHDREVEHGLAVDLVLHEQQQDHTGRGAEAERGHEHTEGRGVAADAPPARTRDRAGSSRPPRSSPKPRPTITPRTRGLVRDEGETLLDVADGLRQSSFSSRTVFPRGIGRLPHDGGRHEERARVEEERERLLVDLEGVQRVEAAEPGGERREQREDDRRDRERAVRRDERQRVRRRELLGPARGSAPTRPSPDPRAA